MTLSFDGPLNPKNKETNKTFDSDYSLDKDYVWIWRMLIQYIASGAPMANTKDKAYTTVIERAPGNGIRIEKGRAI